MLFEGRIETTNFQENFDLQVTFGLDTAEEHRLVSTGSTQASTNEVGAFFTANQRYPRV